jgi:DNA-binding HxlR family transcriptional regulator
MYICSMDKTEKAPPAKAPPATALPALCPTVERAFEILGKKWSGLIIRELSAGPRHFCELEK